MDLDFDSKTPSMFDDNDDDEDFCAATYDRMFASLIRLQEYGYQMLYLRDTTITIHMHVLVFVYSMFTFLSASPCSGSTQITENNSKQTELGYWI